MTEAHIVLGLEHSSLISTKKFCETGCKVVFDEKECRVYYKNELVVCGGRDKKTDMCSCQSTPSQKTICWKAQTYQSLPFVVTPSHNLVATPDLLLFSSESSIVPIAVARRIGTAVPHAGAPDGAMEKASAVPLAVTRRTLQRRPHLIEP